MEYDEKLYEYVIEMIELINKFHKQEIDCALRFRHWVQKNILDLVQQSKETFYRDTLSLMHDNLKKRISSDERDVDEFNRKLVEYSFFYFGKKFDTEGKKEVVKDFIEDVFLIELVREDEQDGKE